MPRDKGSSHHLLVELISLRCSLPTGIKESLDPIEFGLFDSIPVVDKTQISKFSDLKIPEEVLAKYSKAPLFSRDALASFLVTLDSRQITDVSAIIVLLSFA
jgi:hypothetical protein